MKHILILAIGATLAVAGSASAGDRGGGHSGGGCGTCGGGHGGGWGGGYNSNVNVNVNANANAYAGASARSYINARGYSFGGGGGGYAYGGGGGGGYYEGGNIGYGGGLVSTGPVVVAGPSAPFGYAVAGFGRNYSNGYYNSCGQPNRYSTTRPYAGGSCGGYPPPPPPPQYQPQYPSYPSYPQYPDNGYPQYPGGHDCDCDYPVANQPFYGVAPPGPTVRGRQGGVRVSGPPVYARQPDAYIQGGPVYVDAPPVNVAPAQIYLEAPDVHVRPSQVNVAPPEIHYLPARPPHEPEDGCCEVSNLPEGAILVPAPPGADGRPSALSSSNPQAQITFSEGRPYEQSAEHFQ